MRRARQTQQTSGRLILRLPTLRVIVDGVEVLDEAVWSGSGVLLVSTDLVGDDELGRATWETAGMGGNGCHTIEPLGWM